MDLQVITYGCNYQIVDDVDAETGLCHIARELACIVEFGFEQRHHRQAHQPAVEAVERTAKVFRRGVVLSEGGGNQYDS